MNNKLNKKPAWVDNLEIAKVYLSTIPRDFSEFFSFVIKPYSLIAIIITVGIIYLSRQQTDLFIRSILEIIGALAASIFGALISESYLKARGNSFVIKKSTSAIRGLQLIRFKVNNITERLNLLVNKKNKRDADEINNLVQNVHKDILNSIKDWSDVNPKAEEITDFYDILAQREAVIKKKNFEKKQLEDQISKSDKKQTAMFGKLEKALEHKREELNKLRSQLNDFTVANFNIAQGSSSASISSPVRFLESDELVSLTPLGVGNQPVGQAINASDLSIERLKHT